jgi:hypothetical protein
MTYKRAIILLVDGARFDTVGALLQNGDLPTIHRYLVEAGSFFPAVTSFPSTTGPAYLPFITGCLPATCNVPGIRWLDKVKFARRWISLERCRSYVGLETYLLNRDIRHDIATIFELLPNAYSIFNSVNRGAGLFKNVTAVSRIWYWYYAHLTDRWGFVDDSSKAKLEGVVRKKDFDLVFAVFPSVDEYSHLGGPDAKEVKEGYRRIDKVVYDIMSILWDRGLHEETLIWIVSDHGLSATEVHFSVSNFLEQRGIKTFFYPKVFRRNCIAADMVSGNGMTHVYFRHQNGWQYPVYLDEIEKMYPTLISELILEKAVDLLAVRKDERTVCVFSERGSAEIRLDGSYIDYEPLTSDPFGYSDIKGRFHVDELLSMTFESDYPDAIYELAHIFTSARCGDMVLSAKPGFDLRDIFEDPEHKGSHGSLHRSHMLVPIITNARLSAQFARTVDIFPTTLKLLGCPCPANIDGKALI